MTTRKILTLKKRPTLSLKKSDDSEHVEPGSLLEKWPGKESKKLPWGKRKNYQRKTRSPEASQRINDAERWLLKNYPDLTGVRRKEIKERYQIEKESLSFGISHLYLILKMLGIK